MHFIAVSENDNKPSASLQIYEILRKRYKVLYISPIKTVLPDSMSCDFVISSYFVLPKTEGRGGIIVFTDDFSSEIKRIIPESFIAVFSNKNERAKEIVLNSNCRFVTVGYSKKDEISISSEEDGKTIISVKTLCKVCENKLFLPCDIVVRHGKSEGSNLLLTVALLILCGYIEDGTEEIIL